MANKTDELNELKKAIQEKKAVIGANRALKSLKLGKLKKIFVSANCSEKVTADIKYYSGQTGCEVSQLSIPNDELGAVCKKQFFIGVIGVLK